MADDSSYDEVISRQPSGRLTKQDIQRARYGAKLDERRHELRQAFFRWVKIVAGVATLGGALAQALKLLNIHF
jgi:hypothetical protein